MPAAPPYASLAKVCAHHDAPTICLIHDAAHAISFVYCRRRLLMLFFFFLFLFAVLVAPPLCPTLPASAAASLSSPRCFRLLFHFRHITPASARAHAGAAPAARARDAELMRDAVPVRRPLIRYLLFAPKMFAEDVRFTLIGLRTTPILPARSYPHDALLLSPAPRHAIFAALSAPYAP